MLLTESGPGPLRLTADPPPEPVLLSPCASSRRGEPGKPARGGGSGLGVFQPGFLRRSSRKEAAGGARDREGAEGEAVEAVEAVEAGGRPSLEERGSVQTASGPRRRAFQPHMVGGFRCQKPAN